MLHLLKTENTPNQTPHPHPPAVLPVESERLGSWQHYREHQGCTGTQVVLRGEEDEGRLPKAMDLSDSPQALSGTGRVDAGPAPSLAQLTPAGTNQEHTTAPHPGAWRV